MNVFNRIVMVLLVLCLFALVATLLVLPIQSVGFVRTYLDVFEMWVPGEQAFLIFLLGGAIILLLLFVLFILEVRNPRRKTVRIKTKGGGKAQLGIESVAQNLEYRIDELAGVRKVKPRISSRGRDVVVRIQLDTSPSVNVPVLTDQIIDLCHDIIETQLGVKIHGKVEVDVRHEPYPRGTMPATGPLGPEPIQQPPMQSEPGSGPEFTEPAPAAALPSNDSPYALKPQIGGDED